jgi:uncharacterized protein YjbI with pentapeptide repeats
MSDKERSLVARPDFRCADLSNKDMAGHNLQHADLRAANLRGCNFAGSDLRYADLRGASAHGACFKNALLYGAKLQGLEAFGADFRGADMRQANTGGAYFDGAMRDSPFASPAEIAEKLGNANSQVARNEGATIASQQSRVWEQEYEEGGQNSEGGNTGSDQNDRKKGRVLHKEQRDRVRGRGGR